MDIHTGGCNVKYICDNIYDMNIIKYELICIIFYYFINGEINIIIFSHFFWYTTNNLLFYCWYATWKRSCVATWRDIYYTEMYKTLTDYNDHNNIPLSNDNIWEEIHKIVEEESISYSNNITAGTCSHTPNT